jgi:hypothetical protein
MKKYKDSFETRSESLEQGGEGILTAVVNKDPKAAPTRARPPEFSAPKNSSSISPIRTLADDLEHTVREGGVSLAQQALENKTHERKDEDRGPEANRRAKSFRQKRAHTKSGPSKTFVFLLFALVVFGGSLYVFLSKQNISLSGFKVSLPSFNFAGSPPEEVPEEGDDPLFPEALVQVDDSRSLPLETLATKSAQEQILASESQNASEGEIIALFPTQTITTEEGVEETSFADMSSLAETLDISLLTTLSRSIDDYTFGVLGGSEGQAFLVAEVRSYEEVFGTLLQREATMSRELYGVFHSNLGVAVNSSNAQFTDRVVLGNDARVLIQTTESTGPEGERVREEEDILAYMFVGEKTLIIAGSREDLERIAARMR